MKNLLLLTVLFLCGCGERPQYKYAIVAQFQYTNGNIGTTLLFATARHKLNTQAAIENWNSVTKTQFNYMSVIPLNITQLE